MTNPFEHEKRRRLTGQELAEIFARCNGHCKGQCKRKLRPADKWDADHITALENGGTNDIENFQVLCEMCHSAKTRNDHAKAGHARRTYTKHNVPSEHRRSRSWGRR